MKPIRVVKVVPSLPAPLERLRAVAYNLRWAWSHDAIELFRRLDSDLWERTNHNAVLMLGSIDQNALEAAAYDDGYLAHLDRIAGNLSAYLAGETSWFKRTHGREHHPVVAYFSAEFGITECLSIFAGGLGVLAGDHLKSASDLGVPLVGVGLLYQQGYFRQYLNAAGWQQEAYEDNDFHNLPVTLERRADGTPLTIEIAYPPRTAKAQIWRVEVGRVKLYLLDTNIEDNDRTDRIISDQLYGGDGDMRIRQEILLGIGGYRALEALGLQPTVYHMNEGHSAFLALERIRRLRETLGLSFAEARAAASSGLVFTTHTPVEAGHDYFPADRMARFFTDYAGRLGLPWREFLGLGRRDPSNDSEDFCMTVLALRLASFRNGVSRLHGDVSRRIWRPLWPGVPAEETPIDSVTNGVHFRSWISHDMNQLYDRYLGPNWREEPADVTLWQRVQSIPAEELWRTHERRRERLVAFARRRLRQHLARRGAQRAELDAAEEVLDPEALTIGFARRFATYKRATLLLRDKERLARIVNQPGRPVQIIFAGKAHPQDNPGKELIQQIVGLARQPEFRRRLVFLEDYDMAVSRYLVQGVDVWLNTPLRPLEASGTSGMKAAANGVLNLSTLDGWWDEAWRSIRPEEEPIGWAIGHGENYDDHAYQDQVEAEALYDLMERDVVPTFYDRRADGLPRRWIGRMKASISNLCSFFNTHRMVREYTELFYLAADTQYRHLTEDNAARARSLAAWEARVRQEWPQLRVVAENPPASGPIYVGDEMQLRARVYLGQLSPDDVTVELYRGRVDAAGELVDTNTVKMELAGRADDGGYLFEARAVACYGSGLHGYTVRVLPSHPDLTTAFLPGLILWA